jgi:outer membrane protein
MQQLVHGLRSWSKVLCPNDLRSGPRLAHASPYSRATGTNGLKQPASAAPRTVRYRRIDDWKADMNSTTTTGALVALLLFSVVAADATAQQPPATLSLQEAVQLARRYSPAYQMQVNDEAVANWNVRSAYGSFLPSINVRSSLDWAAGGSPNIGLLSSEDFGLLRTPDYFFSGYGVSFGMNISGGTFFRLMQERSGRDATRARIDAAGFLLESDVTRQYLSAMRARDAVGLARRELETAEEALRLAEARMAAGAAMRLDVTQAEVDRGRAEVTLLQAHAAEETEKLRLLQRLGLDLEYDVELTTALEIFEPRWTLEDLTRAAMQDHPQLMSARASESASRAAARAARMTYLPSLSINGGWSGDTRMARDESYLLTRAEDSAAQRVRSCEAQNELYSRLAQPLPPSDCSRYAFSAELRDAVLAANSRFPFDFTRRPLSVGMTLSLPVFNGFSREAQVQTASAAAEDARHQRREEELNRRATVATAHLALQTAYRSVGLEAGNAAAAAEHLELARERYRLGAGSILELTQAQATKARADQAHLTALYAFHENLAALEAAVGQPLR